MREVDLIAEKIPRLAGWYTLDAGTAYWDGSSWTGDYRPPRRSRLAAASHHRILGSVLVCAGAGLIVLGFMSFWRPELTFWGWRDAQTDGLFDDLARAADPPSSLALFLEALATCVACLMAGSALAAGGVYCLRGRGPTTHAVRERLKRERRAESGRQWAGAALAIALNAVAAGSHRRSIERVELLRELEEMMASGQISREQFEEQRDQLFPS